MATYVTSGKRILICGLNIEQLPVDLSYYKFGSDFSKIILILLEALRLNDNRFV